MAERRMFAKTIVLSDAFLDMPMSARCLYFTLGMFADDDGFVNGPRAIMRQCGASDDDMKLLIAKKFVLLFESGVIVVKHWRVNNYLRSDRYTATKYAEEKAQLSVDDKGIYHRTDSLETDIPHDGIPPTVYPGKDSIGHSRIGEEREGEVIDNNNHSLTHSCAREERKAEVTRIRRLIQSYNRLGYDPTGIYERAAEIGITREEIDAEEETEDASE